MPTALEAHEGFKRHLQAHHGPGQHIFQRCILCGHARWMQSHPTVESQIIYDDMASSECPRCAEVCMRAPEIYQWVAGTVAATQLRMELAIAKADERSPTSHR